MVGYLTLNKLLDPLQSAFKAYHNTTTALLRVADDFSRAHFTSGLPQDSDLGPLLYSVYL
jgi:hypothetical protein